MFLTVREISDQLRVCERTVWGLIKDGRLSATRISRNVVRVRVDEVARFINDCTDQPMSTCHGHADVRPGLDENHGPQSASVQRDPRVAIPL